MARSALGCTASISSSRSTVIDHLRHRAGSAAPETDRRPAHARSRGLASHTAPAWHRDSHRGRGRGRVHRSAQKEPAAQAARSICIVVAAVVGYLTVSTRKYPSGRRWHAPPDAPVSLRLFRRAAARALFICDPVVYFRLDPCDSVGRQGNRLRKRLGRAARAKPAGYAAPCPPFPWPSLTFTLRRIWSRE